MATSVTIGFDANRHTLDEMGWVMSYDDGTGTIVSSVYDTLTLATAAMQNIFTADISIDNVLRSQVTTTFVQVPANVTTVNTNLSAKRTAEGLDPTTTPV